MTAEEFSNQFDVLYNNITSNQAPGLTEYEKSVFLTKGQNEIVKNYFTANSKGNTIGQGFDDSAKRQADFSCLMKTGSCALVTIGSGTATAYTYIGLVSSVSTVLNGLSFKDGSGNPFSVPAGVYAISNSNKITVGANTITVTGLPAGCTQLTVFTSTVSVGGQIDTRSSVYSFPSDVFIVINEAIRTTHGVDLQVVPLRYDEYLRLMSKPYKRPLKYQAWRLLNSGTVSGSTSTKYAEIIIGPNDSISSYAIRYIRFPQPIIVGDLDGLTINDKNYTEVQGCELDPILHEDILQRAVELAKIAWTSTGQDNTEAVLQAGQRSE